MRFGSLFSGIGGMDLGLERAGCKLVFQCEINPFRRRVLARHWPYVVRFNDIRKLCRRLYDCHPEDEEGECYCPRCGTEFGECECIGTDQFNDEWGPIELLAGRDPRPALGAEFIRVVDELRPRLVLRETVTQGGTTSVWPWWRFRQALERLGYAVIPFRIRDCCVGADFQRERVFLLGELSEPDSQRLEGPVGHLVAQGYQARQDADLGRPARWSARPQVCRKTTRLPGEVDRLKSLGGCCTPATAERIGRLILQSLPKGGDR